LKTVADGKAYDQREVGKGIADAYKAQAQVLGPTATAAIKLMDEVGVNKVKITRTFSFPPRAETKARQPCWQPGSPRR